ncbi:hypothetical protein CAEBREN_07433 [Caenorhabditis brenneri]|uniref:Uncharacterized protein n=1 Tax=Caenorhabditis brenneri TaxID=135651 RepID=G0PGT9_CAEBE|nr:hypothetical protein CAEBREN_07433 [Caenorhabditis brenneri]
MDSNAESDRKTKDDESTPKQPQQREPDDVEELQKTIQEFKDGVVDELIEINSTAVSAHQALLRQLENEVATQILMKQPQQLQDVIKDNFGFPFDHKELSNKVGNWFQKSEAGLVEAISRLKLQTSQLALSCGYYETQLDRAQIQDVRKNTFEAEAEMRKEASAKCSEIRKERRDAATAVKVTEQLEQAKLIKMQKEAEKEEKRKKLEEEQEEQRRQQEILAFRNRISYSSAATKLSQPNPVLQAQTIPQPDDPLDSFDVSTEEEEDEVPQQQHRLRSVVVVPDTSHLKPRPPPTLKSIVVVPERPKPRPPPALDSIVVVPQKTIEWMQRKYQSSGTHTKTSDGPSDNKKRTHQKEGSDGSTEEASKKSKLI